MNNRNAGDTVNKAAKTILAIFIALFIVCIALPIVGAVIVANNPETIGDWFRRLIGG